MAGLGPLSEPELVTILSDPEVLDDDPALTADLLEMYFSSERDGGLGESDIWRSVRASADADWEPPEHVPELSSGAFDTSVALAADGLSIWISSDREGGIGGTDIWVSQRPDRQSAWSEPILETSLSSEGDEITRRESRPRRYQRWPGGAALSGAPPTTGTLGIFADSSRYSFFILAKRSGSDLESSCSSR